MSPPHPCFPAAPPPPPPPPPPCLVVLKQRGNHPLDALHRVVVKRLFRRPSTDRVEGVVANAKLGTRLRLGEGDGSGGGGVRGGHDEGSAPPQTRMSTRRVVKRTQTKTKQQRNPPFVFLFPTHNPHPPFSFPEPMAIWTKSTPHPVFQLHKRNEVSAPG